MEGANSDGDHGAADALGDARLAGIDATVKNTI